jgi:GNAT superfamily N-acetyltransferase
LIGRLIHPTLCKPVAVTFSTLFVEPFRRGQSLARALMGIALEEAKLRDLEYLILHATAMAMPMYEKLGWRRTSEMSMTLPVQP